MMMEQKPKQMKVEPRRSSKGVERTATTYWRVLRQVGRNFHARTDLLCARSRIFSALNKQACSFSSAFRVQSMLGIASNRPFGWIETRLNDVQRLTCALR
jgi:hypothetical protein